MQEADELRKQFRKEWDILNAEAGGRPHVVLMADGRAIIGGCCTVDQLSLILNFTKKMRPLL